VANNDVVVSGIRPTGVPHLGNLRGALQQWVDLQEKYPCFYFIADWHALFGLEERSREIKEIQRKYLPHYLQWDLIQKRAPSLFNRRCQST